jgi:hypothetical protein
MKFSIDQRLGALHLRVFEGEKTQVRPLKDAGSDNLCQKSNETSVKAMRNGYNNWEN